MATPEQMQQWMKQWRHAEKELARIKAEDMANLTDEQACRMSYSLLSNGGGRHPDDPPSLTSGLVEQQKWFRKWKN